MHTSAPFSLYFPATQLVHVSLLVASTAVLLVPFGHAKQPAPTRGP